MDNREEVNYQSIEDGSYSVTFDKPGVTVDIFAGSAATSPVNVGSGPLTINIDLGESGLKMLIGLTLSAINLKDIRVIATEDSEEATESPEEVSTSH